MSRIGLFGGTFNPPHNAHHRLALEATQACALDKVIIMPTYLPPHKSATELLSGRDRLELCRRTFTEDCFSFSDYELNKGGKSYTVETLRHLKAQLPEDEFFLIVGSDMLLSFDRWYCWQEILTLCSLIVLSREEDISRQDLMDYAENTLHLAPEEFHVLTCPPQTLSSTQIRTMLQNGEDVSPFLSESALRLIKEKGYYQ